MAYTEKLKSGVFRQGSLTVRLAIWEALKLALKAHWIQCTLLEKVLLGRSTAFESVNNTMKEPER